MLSGITTMKYPRELPELSHHKIPLYIKILFIRQRFELLRSGAKYLIYKNFSPHLIVMNVSFYSDKQDV